jgi:hypothetical protein
MMNRRQADIKELDEEEFQNKKAYEGTGILCLKRLSPDNLVTSKQLWWRSEWNPDQIEVWPNECLTGNAVASNVE